MISFLSTIIVNNLQLQIKDILFRFATIIVINLQNGKEDRFIL